MPDLKTVYEEAKRTRDEVALKIHLGSRDLKDEWERVEKRWKEFEAKAQLDRTAKDLGVAADLLGSELKSAYTRIRQALQ